MGPVPSCRRPIFSAEAALSLLALAGASTVRSLGVDGGAAYSPAFDDLRDTTLLANGRQNFNLQFRGSAKTIMSTGVDYAPLDVESPIRVYVGSQEAQMLGVKVLEYSIRKHASMSVEVMPLHHANVSYPTPRPSRTVPAPPSRSSASTSRSWRGFAAAPSTWIPTCRSFRTSRTSGRFRSTAPTCSRRVKRGTPGGSHSSA